MNSNSNKEEPTDDGKIDIYETQRWSECGEYLYAPEEIREFINQL